MPSAPAAPADPGAGISSSLQSIFRLAEEREASLHRLPTTAAREDILNSLRMTSDRLPESGLGTEGTIDFLLKNVTPALAPGQAGSRYFGFVTGGQVPAATLADFLVTLFDSNVQVNLPDETICTYIEHLALSFVLSLLDLPASHFTGRTFTTGATSSNILGLLCARDHAVRRFVGDPAYSVAESGFPQGLGGVDVWTCGAHASLKKAASVVGIGRAAVKDVGNPEKAWEFDLKTLESNLAENKRKGRASIVSPSCGEVNTGGVTPHMQEIRALCDKYDAWLHIDGAFGAFAALHKDFASLPADLALADSLTLDGHKWLQAPYDCGLFYTRDLALLTSITGPGIGRSGPAYLAAVASSSAPPIPSDVAEAYDISKNLTSPLHVRLENSSRFRGLPLYATLLSLGRQGVTDVVVRNIEFARSVEAWLREGPGREDWDVLTPAPHEGGFQIMNIVLFAPKRGDARDAIGKINGARAMYVSPTQWRGRNAVRMAVSNWRTGIERAKGEKGDLEIVLETLARVGRELQ